MAVGCLGTALAMRISAPKEEHDGREAGVAARSGVVENPNDESTTCQVADIGLGLPSADAESFGQARERGRRRRCRFRLASNPQLFSDRPFVLVCFLFGLPARPPLPTSASSLASGSSSGEGRRREGRPTQTERRTGSE